MDAADLFLAWFAAERPLGLLVALRAMCERRRRVRAIQAPPRAGRERAVAAQQVDGDRLVFVVKLMPLPLQPHRRQEPE